MKITFLGTGTSQGVPVIGCQCEVCTSEDWRDNRLRTAALIETGHHTFLIDAGPDLRQQLLRAGVNRVDAILMTHEHNDHIIGMDDVRPLNFLHQKPIPVYAEERVQQELKTRFAYIFDENPYPGAPQITLTSLQPNQPVWFEKDQVLPLRIWHGKLPILGFHFGDIAYLTDVNHIDKEVVNQLKGIKVLVLDALHHYPHHSHFNLEQSLAMLEIIQPQAAYLIHISHHMGRYQDVNPRLPDGVQLAYDGLEVEV